MDRRLLYYIRNVVIYINHTLKIAVKVNNILICELCNFLQEDVTAIDQIVWNFI